MKSLSSLSAQEYYWGNGKKIHLQKSNRFFGFQTSERDQSFIQTAIETFGVLQFVKLNTDRGQYFIETFSELRYDSFISLLAEKIPIEKQFLAYSHVERVDSNPL